MTVLHHQRLPDHEQVSIERLFEGIRVEHSPECHVTASVSPYSSAGVLPRLQNLRAASRFNADIHHIVGDVHYLAFGLPGDKLVLTIHDCAALERLKGWQREILRQLWFVQPMRRAAVVTTISETTKEELRRWDMVITATQVYLLGQFYSNVAFNHTASAFVWIIVAAVFAAEPVRRGKKLSRARKTIRQRGREAPETRKMGEE